MAVMTITGEGGGGDCQGPVIGDFWHQIGKSGYGPCVPRPVDCGVWCLRGLGGCTYLVFSFYVGLKIFLP